MSKSRRLVAALVLSALAISGAAAANLPRPSPDFAINLGPGKQLKLSQYKGKPVVLAFILTYCSHCQRTIGFLSKDQQEFGDRVQVVASAIEEMAATALPGFMRQFAPPFPVGYNTNTEANDYLQHPPMVILRMPALAFIDRNGAIQAQYEGGEPFFEQTAHEKNLRDKIEELIKMGAPPAGKNLAKKSGGPAKK
jgi:thiol-disulfide isomerase/thioredoxin